MEFEWLIYGGVAIVGFVSAAGYYAARFYFRLGDEEKLKQLELQQSKVEPQKESIKTKNKQSRDEKALEGEAVAKEPIDNSVQEKAHRNVPKKELKDALFNTRKNLFGRIKGVFSNSGELSSDEIENLEEVLYTSDLGPQTVQRLVEAVGEKLSLSERSNLEMVCNTIKSEMLEIFSKISDIDSDSDDLSFFKGMDKKNSPQVWMIVGVNGAGKTTTIGKLAFASATAGLKTLVIAGDTFRAAAGEQLNVWKERAGVEIFSPEGVKDPSAVAFDGCQMAKANGFDVIIVDTAGRLHTQDNLMEELKKMKRVLNKVIPDAPNETLIVLDANSGQNALIQTKNFNQAIGLSGVVLTKLDGSAKGGVAVGLANEFSLPIKFIGVGEAIEDLRSFKPREFVDSII